MLRDVWKTVKKYKGYSERETLISSSFQSSIVSTFFSCSQLHCKRFQHLVSSQYFSNEEISQRPCLAALSVAGREGLCRHASSIPATSATGWATKKTTLPHLFSATDSNLHIHLPRLHEQTHTCDVLCITFKPDSRM